MKENALEVNLKIATEATRVCQFFDSCRTKEQLENTNKLACFLVDKWSWIAAKFGLGYAWRKIWPMIECAAKLMDDSYKKNKTRIEWIS